MSKSSNRKPRQWRTAALLFVLAIACSARVANLRWMATQTVSSAQFAWAESDMATHWRWAGLIVDGDVLTRGAHAPYPPWMQEIAPLETWDRWHGPHVFNKAPLYPYVLAGMRAAFGERYLAIGSCHVVLGLLNVALVFLLAARFFDLAAAIVAGLGAALYGPFLLYETFLLRDALAVTVSLVLLLALSRCTSGARGAWMLAGVAFALALLGCELVAPFGALVAVWIWQRFRGQPARMIAALGAFALGVALGILPLVARNLAVGAPPFALSAIGVEGIVYGHAVDSAPAAFRVPAAAARVLHDSDGRVLATIRGTLATYEGDWGRLARNELARAAAILSGLEGADNVNWYYFAGRSRLLAWSLRYEVLVGLGLVGLWLARRRVRGDDRIVLYYLAVSIAALQFVPVIGRYRLVVAALLLVYGAVTVVVVARALAARDGRAAAGPMLVSACLPVVSARLLLVPGVGERCRSAEYAIVAQDAADRQDPEALYDTLRDCVDCLIEHADADVLPPEFHVVAEDFTTMARALARSEEAGPMLDRLTARYARDPVLPGLAAAVRTPLPPEGT